MKNFGIIVIAALAAAAAGAFAAPAAELSITENWSGYAAIGAGSTISTASPSMAFTDVTATWKQPKASCTVGERTSAAFWVGLGGYSETSQALEQAGTEVDCDENGKPSYYAWYELVPAGSVTVRLKVAPGDTITAAVVANGTDITLQVKNRTRRTSFTRHLTMDAPDLTSAEWIAEAPDICEVGSGRCITSALTSFGTFAFSKIAAIGNGAAGRLTGPGWRSSKLRLVPYADRGYGRAATRDSSGAGGRTSPPTADGSGFTVTWLAKA